MTDAQYPPIAAKDVPPEEREPLIEACRDIWGDEAAEELRQELYPN